MAEVVHIQKQPNPRALFRQPLALQWFQDGELVKRKEDERQAGRLSHLVGITSSLELTYLRLSGRFELFLDLLYVAILANFAENLAEHASGASLVKYIVSFCLLTATGLRLRASSLSSLHRGIYGAISVSS